LTYTLGKTDAAAAPDCVVAAYDRDHQYIIRVLPDGRLDDSLADPLRGRVMLGHKGGNVVIDGKVRFVGDAYGLPGDASIREMKQAMQAAFQAAGFNLDNLIEVRGRKQQRHIVKWVLIGVVILLVLMAILIPLPFLLHS
jgi:hypothetical protein